MTSQLIFRILEIYGGVSLQALPKGDRRRFGVPPRGAFDLPSHEMANALLGNADESSTLELSLAALTIEILQEGDLAWVGAGAWDGVQRFGAGQRIQFPFPKDGVRSYVAAIDGLRSDQPIAKGAVLESKPGYVARRTLSQARQMVNTVRVVKGSHAPLFNWNEFLSGRYKVSQDSNRMGIRLTSRTAMIHPHRLTSEPTDVGIVQMPNSGNPIILGPDGPTIGGYPKIALVIEADLPVVAQLAPGQEMTFHEIDRESARKIYQEEMASLEKLKWLLRLQSEDAVHNRTAQ